MGNETPEEITRIVDPENTFLDECEKAKQFIIKCKTSDNHINGK